MSTPLETAAREVVAALDEMATAYGGADRLAPELRAWRDKLDEALNPLCPKCKRPLWHQIGEDEFGGDVLIPYDRLSCITKGCDFGWCDTDDYYDDDPAVNPRAAQRFRHRERGTVYKLLRTVALQRSGPPLAEGARLNVYAPVDGKMPAGFDDADGWAREVGEFNDGRFEEIL